MWLHIHHFDNYIYKQLLFYDTFLSLHFFHPVCKNHNNFSHTKLKKLNLFSGVVIQWGQSTIFSFQELPSHHFFFKSPKIVFSSSYLLSFVFSGSLGDDLIEAWRHLYHFSICDRHGVSDNFFPVRLWLACNHHPAAIFIQMRNNKLIPWDMRACV